MPSLPRIKRPRSRTRAEEPVVAARREPAELAANGLTWIHLDAPDQEAPPRSPSASAGTRSTSRTFSRKRQRPKVDEYPDYLFAVLHFPFYDKAVQRLNAAELDVFLGPDYLVTLPNVELLPVSPALPALLRRPRAAREPLRERAPATCSTTSSTTSSTTASRSWTRSATSSTRSRTTSRGPLRGDRPRHLEREAGDHLLPQDHQAAAPDASPLERPSSASCPRSWISTSTTSSTPPSASGTCSTTTRRSSRRSRRRTSRRSRTGSDDVLRILTVFSVVFLPADADHRASAA